MDGRSTKRSRFDQTEPEPRRPSRFDRRSRSPPGRKPDSDRERERSPLSRPRDAPTGPKSPVDPAAAAAAAAAKINAQLQARKGIQHVDVPPVRSASSGKEGSAGPALNGEVYVADGDFIKDIEVNDLRNRYLLTKGSTQKMIKDETGADVTTRGSYFPDKSMATPANPPLYLHVTSTTKEGLDKAVAKIEELMKQELPQLVDERRFQRRPNPEQPPVERDEFGRRKWPEEKIAITLESVPGFNLRAQVVGHGGAYVKHIQSETGCRVQIKGRGSGYIESSTGRESEEDMYLHVAGPDPLMVKKAKELCEDLLDNVKQEYEAFKSRPPPQRHYNGGGGGGGGYGGGRGGGDSFHGQAYNRDSHSHHNSSHSQSHSYSNSPAPPAASSSASPAPAASTPTATNPADYAAQYAQYMQYYGSAAAGADPYAAYGGYEAYMRMYQQWMASQPQQAPAAPGASASPPPPPPSDAAPPPPPPSSAPPPPPPGGPPGASGGMYSAQPPPPGL
ncbi:Putative protein of unknown function [Podospora comata]|uniref:K Homology domain-containing protein n=1 Tax=Podospora comata TaxID=48703 RepID=A0ABY6S6T9_PODCO|nr:Putative protein of unknown function [Podospora comata]